MISRIRMFTCNACGGTFEIGWSDDEAAADLNTNFPGVDQDDCVMICSDCFPGVLASIRKDQQ